MITVILLSYFQLLLLTIHSRFLNRGQYVGMMVTNIVIAVIYCTMFKTLREDVDDPWTIVAYAIGTTLGGISGVWLHKHFFKEKP